MPLFNIKPAMLEKYPQHMRELLRRDRIKEERALIRDRMHEVSVIGRWVIAGMSMVVILVWLIRI